MNRRMVFYWLIGIVIAAAIVVVAFHFDEPARNFLSQHQNLVLRNFMHRVSRFGDWPEHFALGLILTGLACWRRSKKWTRIFVSMLIALAIAGAAARVVKIAAGRARPSVKTEAQHLASQGAGWNGPRLSFKYHAFPSGHVAASTAFFVVLLLANRQIGLACMPIPILIGFSRMYVAAHYLSDVVCATILGILCAMLVEHFLRRQIENQKSKIAN